MSSNLVIIDRDHLQQIIETAIFQATARDSWISQNQACRLIGRRRLETAMQRNLVRWEKKDINNPRGRVYVSRKDVERLIKTP